MEKKRAAKKNGQLECRALKKDRPQWVRVTSHNNQTALHNPIHVPGFLAATFRIFFFPFVRLFSHPIYRQRDEINGKCAKVKKKQHEKKHTQKKSLFRVISLHSYHMVNVIHKPYFSH